MKCFFTSIITILEPIAYTADEFGVSIGPVVYSNVDCGGWENYLIECQKNNYLEITCSYATVAGVLCADGQCQYLSVKKYDICTYNITLDCSDGDIRLVGGETRSEGTVEICFDSLWGLIDESGWGIADAIVICRELGFHESTVGMIILYMCIMILSCIIFQKQMHYFIHIMVNLIKPFILVMWSVMELKINLLNVQ